MSSPSDRNLHPAGHADAEVSPELLSQLAALRRSAAGRKSRDAVPLDLLLPRVQLVVLAGRAWPVAPLRLRDLADLQGWLADQTTHPLEAIAGDKADEGSRRQSLRVAWQAARDWPPKLGSIEAGEILASAPGRVAFLLVCLRRCDPTVTAATLRPWLATRAPGAPVLHVPTDTADVLSRDLERAGIPYRDRDGRVADFHSLRGAYITALVRSGVDPATVQRLARHSDVRLTLTVYTSTGREDLRRAVDGE